MMKEIQSFFEIDDRLCALAEQAEERCKPVFAAIDQRAAYNGAKVLKAFQNNRVSEPCFYGSTGYGYGDQGREVLDKVVAEAFGAEDALVRHNFVSGTHALTVALFGVLRTGDKMVSITGRPYDTLEGVIGLTGNKGDGSLMDYGVTYDEVPLLEDGTPNYDAIPEAVRGAKIAYIQRSRGYALRPAFTLAQIEKMAQLARSSNPDIIVMVDNCYGEFTDTSEPVQHGADLMIGSMIKNVGGGIARTGGYIAGRKDLVELCSYRLTCVGMGKEVGCTLDMNRELFLGFFHAPDVTASALKTAAFAASLFELLGFACYPRYDEPRNDIVEAICLGDEAHLTAFCQGIQAGSPVDSFVVPEAWDMPGYTSKVIMAAGAFTLGASIELSADAPIREPFAVWILSTLVLYLIVPCVILNAFQVDYTPEKVSGLMLACIASLLLLFILLPIVNLIGKVLHLNEVETMSIYYSNSGNMIVPLVAFMLGEEWVFYACVFMGIQTIFFWTHCKNVLSHEKGFNLKKIFTNINIITIIAAIVLFFAKIRLPEIITGTLSSVGAMVGPASMFVIGMLMGGMNIRKVLTNKKAYFIALMRLIGFPFIALLILKISGLVGWNADGKKILLIVFLAIIAPAASTVTQMSQVYGNDSRYASTINVLTTLGAIVTMPLMVLVFQMVM